MSHPLCPCPDVFRELLLDSLQTSSEPAALPASPIASVEEAVMWQPRAPADTVEVAQLWCQPDRDAVSCLPVTGVALERAKSRGFGMWASGNRGLQRTAT